MNLTKNNNENRIIYFDYLRILATIAVIIIHTVSQRYYFININTYEWNILNMYHCITLWCVPIFVMISGSLFLEQNHNIKILYKKYILRIVTAFIFWTILYAISNIYTYGCGISCYISSLFEGHYHMWFLFMIIGLYMITPFLKKIIESPKLTKYFLLLSLIFTFILPQTISFISLISPEATSILNNIIDNFSFHFTLGFSGYFICGYYLNKIELTKKWKNIIYIFGIISLIITIILNKYISIHTQEPSTIFYDYLNLNVLFQSLFIFLLVKKNLNKPIKNKKFKNIINKISKYSFGIYLVHPLIIYILDISFNLNCLSFNPLISIPIITIIVFIVSLSISAILNRIPFINKHIV